MVWLTKNLFYQNKNIKATMRKKKPQSWIDSLRIYVKGGSGGAGLPPVDGVGGHGGSVYIRASEEVSNLHDVRRRNTKQRYVAQAGEDSS